jgi:hypothetical protein
LEGISKIAVFFRDRIFLIGTEELGLLENPLQIPKKLNSFSRKDFRIMMNVISPEVQP